MRSIAAAAVLTALSLGCGSPSNNPNGPVGPTNCAAPPSADGGVSAVVNGNSQVGVDLLGQLGPAANGGNVFFSPFSISSALAMTYAGAAGSTATQLAAALHFGADPGAVAQGFGALGCELTADGAGPDGGQLDIANAVFGQKGATFEPPFLSLLSSDLGAPLQTVDFAGAPDAARQAINGWVSENTRGKIPQLLAPGSVDSSMRLALANALYFTGSWAAPFDPAATKPASFQTSSGAVSTPMMAGVREEGYVKGAGFAALELSFQGASVAMDLLLPDAPDGLSAFEASLTAASLSATLAQLTPTQLQVELPKFALDSKLDLIPTFKQLGLTLPFDPGQADFSGMDGQKDLSISLLRHEGVLEVDEVGATAAAATVVGLGRGSAAPALPPTSFIADHPFLLVIRDLPTGTLLFLGQVTDPTRP